MATENKKRESSEPFVFSSVARVKLQDGGIEGEGQPAQNGLIEIDAYTGAIIDRGWYELVLSTQPGAVDSSKLDTGRAPFYQQSAIWDHSVFGLDDHVGNITRWNIEGQTIKLTVQPFPDNMLQPHQIANMAKLRAGLSTNMSIGVTPIQVDVMERKGMPELHTLTRYRIDEVTHVSEGADPNARATKFAARQRAFETARVLGYPDIESGARSLLTMLDSGMIEDDAARDVILKLSQKIDEATGKNRPVLFTDDDIAVLVRSNLALHSQNQIMTGVIRNLLANSVVVTPTA